MEPSNNKLWTSKPKPELNQGIDLHNASIYVLYLMINITNMETGRNQGIHPHKSSIYRAFTSATLKSTGYSTAQHFQPKGNSLAQHLDQSDLFTCYKYLPGQIKWQCLLFLNCKFGIISYLKHKGWRLKNQKRMEYQCRDSKNQLKVAQQFNKFILSISKRLKACFYFNRHKIAKVYYWRVLRHMWIIWCGTLQFSNLCFLQLTKI